MKATIQVEIKTFGPISASSEEYKELRETLKEHKRFRVWDLNGKSKIKPGIYNVETKQLFDNQSNTVEGFRVFDFADYSRDPQARNARYGHYIQARNTRYGHYIVDTTELEAARNAQHKCGYCGHVDNTGKEKWCGSCRGSEYLEPKDYSLLELKPVNFKGNRDKQPPEEVQQDITAQQLAAAKVKLEKHCKAKIDALEQKNLNVQYEIEFLKVCEVVGLAEIALNNMIYHSHTNKFTFGWRKTLDAATVADIKAKLGDNMNAFDVDFTTPSF